MTAPHLRSALRQSVLALLTALAATASAQAQIAQPPSARQRTSAADAYLRGARHLSTADYTAAEADFARAASLDPAHTDYIAALALTREHRISALLQQSAQARAANPAAANALLDQARALDSTNPRVAQHTQGLPALATQPAQPHYAGVIQLQPKPILTAFHQRSDTRILVANIAAAYGLRVVLDTDLKTQQLRIDLDDADFPTAMRIFTLLSGTMFVPLDEHSFLIANDNVANRTRLERLVEQTYYLNGMSPDQIKDFVTIAQTVFDFKQVSIQQNLNAIVLRAPADQMNAIDLIFADLIRNTNNDVVLDLKLYEVNKQHIRNLGATLPASVNGYNVAAQAQSIVNSNSALIQQLISAGVIPANSSASTIALYIILSGAVSSSLISNSFVILGGGLTTTAISAGGGTINLALNESDARTIDDVQLRVADRQTVIFKTGVRYPIQTSLFSDIATSSVSNATINGVSVASLLASYLGTSGSGSTVIPQVQYEDIGLTVTAIPRIQRTADVTMHLDIKISSLAGTSLNGIPVLASRQFTSDLTLHDGQSAFMVSNVTQSESGAVTGVPGLSEVPGFQSTTNRNGNRISGDLVLLITPHIVHRTPADAKGPYVPLAHRPDYE